MNNRVLRDNSCAVGKSGNMSVAHLTFDVNYCIVLLLCKTNGVVYPMFVFNVKQQNLITTQRGYVQYVIIGSTTKKE